MKTDELIDLLTRGEEATVRPRIGTRFAGLLACGMAGVVLLMLLTLGIRPDFEVAWHLPEFWWKLAYPVVLGVVALVVTLRLAIPGRRPGRASLLLWLLPLAAVTAAAVILARTAPEARMPLLRGDTWLLCPWLIAVLAAPAFVAILAALRGMAPTRHTLAGACAGLLSGAIGASAYCIHCPETQVPFWGTWYTLGMLIPTLLGALLGPRLLRW